jgi:hypothetical protein
VTSTKITKPAMRSVTTAMRKCGGDRLKIFVFDIAIEASYGVDISPVKPH